MVSIAVPHQTDSEQLRLEERNAGECKEASTLSLVSDAQIRFMHIRGEAVPPGNHEGMAVLAKLLQDSLDDEPHV